MPEHWEEDRLKRFSLRVTDGAHISPDLSSPYFPFVSTVDLSGGKSDFDGCLRTSDERYSYLVRTGCRPHQSDLLFSKDGTVGRTALVEVDREFVVASSLVIVSPRPTRLDAKFLDYWLNNSLLQQDILLQMSGAALRRISVEKVSRLPVWLPSPTEQRAIASFLDRGPGRVDRLVAKKLELIERLKEKRTALISQTVTRGLPAEAASKAGLPINPHLKPSGLDWLGDIPKHWEVYKLKRVTISRCDGPFGSGLKSEHYADEGVRVIRLQNIRFAKFDNSDAAFIEPEYYKELGDHSVQPGDLLIAGLGDENHPVGRAYVAPSDLGSAMVKADCFRFRLNSKRAVAAYLGKV